MLTRETTTSGPRRQIAVASATDAVVLYVVPAGRTFVGTIHGGGIRLNQSAAFSLPGSSVPLPVTLIGGTVVTQSGTTQTCLIGVEQ